MSANINIYPPLKNSLQCILQRCSNRLKQNDIFKWICPNSVWPLYAVRAIASSVANLVISPLDLSVLYLQAGILAAFHAKLS